MRRLLTLGLLFVFAAACSPQQMPLPVASPVPSVTVTRTIAAPTVTMTAVPSVTPSPTPRPLIPNFEHIVILIFENKEYGSVIGNYLMPNYNRYAKTYTLLNAHYAIRRPSLPNYLALIGGDTFSVTTNCNDCYIDSPSLPDLIEANGRTWRTYQERMPSACFLGDAFKYDQKHNPFIYFTPIRENAERCKQGIVPLTQLDSDLAAKSLPNFVFITPDSCNSAHDCPVSTADAWLGEMVPKLQNYLEAEGEPYLIILTWDEGQGEHGCCGLPQKAGGRVPTVLISPQAKPGFQDETPYTHYSVLKTISAAWRLPYLLHADDIENVLMIAPWK